MNNHDTLPSSGGYFRGKDKCFVQHKMTKTKSSVLIHKRIEKSLVDELRDRILDVGAQTNNISSQFKEVEMKQDQVIKAQNEIMKLFEDLALANVTPKSN